MTTAIAFLLLVITLVSTRQWLARRRIRPPRGEPFDGVAYRVGRAFVAERNVPGTPAATVICMHGLVESQRYFTAHYTDPALQLILLTSGGYHLPVEHPDVRDPSWAQVPGAPEGSIGYDAEVLVQTLEQLPRADTIRVHGHSRGGAVVLEAAAMRPALFEGVEVVLEAPVLPGARTVQRINALGLWLFPFQLAIWQLAPINRANRAVWGDLSNPRKRELVSDYPYNAGDVPTLLANARNIRDWMRDRGYAVFADVRRATILIPEYDRVLDPATMAQSAAHAAEGTRVVHVPACSHFILQDRPTAIPPLQARARQAP